MLAKSSLRHQWFVSHLVLVYPLRAMRRLVQSATFLLLLAGLVLLWQNRFERVPGCPALSLATLRAATPNLPADAEWRGDLAQPALRLTVAPGHPPVALRLHLPGLPAVQALHFRFRMAASKLTLGKQPWDDGRVLIEWRSADGLTKQELDPVDSLRDNEAHDERTLVVRPSSGSSLATLRVEHLGSGGEMTVSQLEIIPIQERRLWKYGRWGLLAGWFLWLLNLLAGTSRPIVPNRLLAAGIWLGMVVFCSVPGPWKTLHGLAIPFQLGPAVTTVAPAQKPIAPSSPKTTDLTDPAPAAPADALGQIPLQGEWIIQAKCFLPKLRPLLHALLLFVPTLAFVCLLGRKPAIALAAGLAISTEAAQTAFGYGFDWVDIFDLTCDAAGIALALWVFRRFGGVITAWRHGERGHKIAHSRMTL